jgi:hypothetical protein
MVVQLCDLFQNIHTGKNLVNELIWVFTILAYAIWFPLEAPLENHLVLEMQVGEALQLFVLLVLRLSQGV